MRIAFLVDPSQNSIEKVDQIIGYNRCLWGGRYNPIILTDGNTIETKWWEFLRDVDPDIIKPLIPLGSELIEKFEHFLSPLQIEDYKEDEQSSLGTFVNTRISPASIDMNSLNFANLGGWYGDPDVAAFNLEEMDDDIGNIFLLRNFGTYQPTNTRHHMGSRFSIPISLEDTLSRGEVPPDIHDGFKENNIPFSNEAFCKASVQRPGNWVLIDKENKQRHYVQKMNSKLLIFPETLSFSTEFDEVEKEVFLLTDRDSLSDVLFELARSQKIVYQDQICAFPNSERELQKTWIDRFEIIVGDTLQDIVHFWNRPWLISRWKRKSINQLWIPTTLATDLCMEDALCAWISKYSWWERQNSKAVHFVSFSIEEEALENIASRFREKLRLSTSVKCYEEPQIPDLFSEDPLLFLRENPLSSRDSSIEVHRAQGNKDIFELTEPDGLAQRDMDGHWMADFYIEFTKDMYENHDQIIRSVGWDSFFWKIPNRNHLTYHMFDRFSRVRQNGFPSVMMKRSEKVLRFTLENPESTVASLFYRDNRFVYVDSDPRVQLMITSYSYADVSDKGKYLQGVLKLFGNLTFAYEIFRNPYWRSMFDLLSKNTRAEQDAQVSVTNKIRKLIDRSESLTSNNQRAIEALAAQIVNIAKNLTIKQKEAPFKTFTAEAERWRDTFIESVTSTGNYSERDLMGFGFRPEDVEERLSQLTEKDIIQIGVNLQCSHCGTTTWSHVDDIGQQLTCQGCRRSFPLHPQLTWQYRLNSLVHAAYVLHGITPVILVLGQLFRNSRDSFLFSPNLNLLTRSKTRPEDDSLEKLEQVAEVDIACIQDGKFIIGEVKQSMRLFRKKDFDDMAEIAKRVKPNTVLFSCIDSQHPTRSITDHIERIKNELCPLKIDVVWYELESLDYSYRV